MHHCVILLLFITDFESITFLCIDSVYFQDLYTFANLERKVNGSVLLCWFLYFDNQWDRFFINYADDVKRLDCKHKATIDERDHCCHS